MWTGLYIPWFIRPQNPGVHGWESHSQPVDHESDALTTAPPSHPVMSERVCAITICVLSITAFDAAADDTDNDAAMR